MKANDMRTNDMNYSEENKKDNGKRTYVLTTLLCLIPVIAGLFLLPKLPDQIVTHWAADGSPNGWSNKITGAVVFPVILVVLNLVLPALMKTDPRYTNMNKKTRELVQWIIPLVSIYCSGTTLANGLGIPMKVAFWTPMFIGLIFVIIGNYMPKMTQSYTLGIKIPWTLKSEENWNKTHRMAGFLWIVGGIVIMAAAFTPWAGEIIPVAFICMVIIPVIYSYLYYRKSC